MRDAQRDQELVTKSVTHSSLETFDLVRNRTSGIVTELRAFPVLMLGGSGSVEERDLTALGFDGLYQLRRRVDEDVCPHAQHP